RYKIKTKMGVSKGIMSRLGEEFLWEGPWEITRVNVLDHTDSCAYWDRAVLPMSTWASISPSSRRSPSKCSLDPSMRRQLSSFLPKHAIYGTWNTHILCVSLRWVCKRGCPIW